MDMDSKIGVLAEIREKLNKYPSVKFEIKETSITIPAQMENGFSVSFHVHDKGYTVSFEGWHEEFTDKDKALECFAFGLSEGCRLKVLKRGNFDYKWVVQHRAENTWMDDSETGLFLFPFWCGKQKRYLQNHLIKDAVTP